MNRQIWFLVVSFVIFFASAGHCNVADAASPALVIMRQYEKELPRMDFFEPYTVCLLALNELEHGRMLPEIREYINWYFAHLNYPDKYDMTGTIYDYVVSDGQECATRKYDSAGAYSGVFLNLLNRYVATTGDKKILKDNWKKIEDIAYTIVYMQDTDDALMRSLPTTDQKKLIDNCEAYGGIKAYNQLRRFLAMEDSKYYCGKEKELKSAIMSLYRPEGGSFVWLIEDGSYYECDWETYYPDAYSQLLPVYYGVLEDDITLAKNILYEFDIKYAQSAYKFTVGQRIIHELTKKKLGSQ